MSLLLIVGHCSCYNMSFHQWLLCRVRMYILESFLFVGVLNGHRQVTLASRITNHLYAAAFDFMNVSSGQFSMHVVEHSIFR